MAALTPFRQSGPTVTLAVQAAPAAIVVQATSADMVGNQQYVLTNTGSKTAFVSMAANQAQALQTAGVPTTALPQPVYVLLSGSQVTITGPVNAFFAGVCQGSDTSVIWITPGYGQ